METAILEDLGGGARGSRRRGGGRQARPFGVVVEECGRTRSRRVIGNKESGLRYVCNAAGGRYARLGVGVGVGVALSASRGGESERRWQL